MPVLATTLTPLPSRTYTPIPTWTPASSLTPEPTTTPTVIGSCIPQDSEAQTAVITRPIDAVTLEVKIDGKLFQVHFIGVGALDPKSAPAKQAIAFNQALVKSKDVKLIKEKTDLDTGGKLLRYVLVDGKFINYELIRNGLAPYASNFVDTKCNVTLSLAERAAQKEIAGVWQPTPTVPLSVIQTKIAVPNYVGGGGGGHSNGSLEVVSANCEPPNFLGTVWIKGTIKNNTSYTVSLVSLRGTIFDNNGNQINTNIGYADSDKIFPGKTSTFAILVDDPNHAFHSCTLAWENVHYN
jgi:endonuclease YncB( thermonuclease family)